MFTTDHEAGLSEKQENALTALLEAPTITQAAAQAGVGRSTLHGWLKEPTFAARYREARRDALSQATARLQKAASAAVQTLERVATDEEAPPASQVAAAEKILSYAYRAGVFEDVEAKIDEWEAYNE